MHAANCNALPPTFAGPEVTAIAALHPAQWVLFVTAGPDVQIGEFRAKDLGKFLDGKTLAGVVSGQQQGDPRRLGFQASMEAGFTSHQEITAGLPRGAKELAGAAAGDGNLAHTLIGRPDMMQANDRKLLL